ncbi:MAG TPA: hypothetical protein DCY12_05815 [Candidatus Atribacteria bacterium]|nr:hypothetical protein [Candidatus Atribacteria bacterium]HCU21822.1 hypothetical protein [Candidatus Atribacteria bacterium]
MNLEKYWPLIFIAWCGVIILFFYLFMTSQYQIIDTLGDQKSTLQNQITVLRKKVSNLEQLQYQLESLKSAAIILEDRLPDEKEIPNLLITVEDAAFLSEAEIQSLVPQNLVSNDGYTEVPFSTALKSSYYSILYFMNYLRQSPRLIQVKNFDFKKDKAEGTFLVQMNLSTYLVAKEGMNQ